MGVVSTWVVLINGCGSTWVVLINRGILLEFVVVEDSPLKVLNGVIHRRLEISLYNPFIGEATRK